MTRASNDSGAWVAPRLAALISFPSAGITQFRCLAVGRAALSAPKWSSRFPLQWIVRAAVARLTAREHTRRRSQPRGRLAGTPCLRRYTAVAGEALRTATLTPRLRPPL